MIDLLSKQFLLLLHHYPYLRLHLAFVVTLLLLLLLLLYTHFHLIFRISNWLFIIKTIRDSVYSHVNINVSYTLNHRAFFYFPLLFFANPEVDSFHLPLLLFNPFLVKFSWRSLYYFPNSFLFLPLFLLFVSTDSFMRRNQTIEKKHSNRTKFSLSFLCMVCTNFTFQLNQW